MNRYKGSVRRILLAVSQNFLRALPVVNMTVNRRETKREVSFSKIDSVRYICIHLYVGPEDLGTVRRGADYQFGVKRKVLRFLSVNRCIIALVAMSNPHACISVLAVLLLTLLFRFYAPVTPCCFQRVTPGGE